MGKKYLKVSEVVDLYGCNRNDVYAALNDGRLKGYKCSSGKWEVLKDQEEALTSLTPRAVPVEKSPETKEYSLYVQDKMHYNVVVGKIREAKRELLITTANLKNVYLDDYGNGKRPLLDTIEELVDRGVTVKIICSSVSQTFLEELKGHKNLIGKHSFLAIKSCLRVHMKMIMFDEKSVYIGSANVTPAALGHERRNKDRNFEAGILTNNKNILKDSYDHFWKVWSNDSCKNCSRNDSCEKVWINR